MSEPRVQQFFLPMDGHLLPGPSDSPTGTPPSADPADLLRLIADVNAHGGYGIAESPKAHMERLLSAAAAAGTSSDLLDSFQTGIEVSAFGLPTDYSQFGDFSVAALRNSSKTLKCPKCNWHYKYQETLEIHMKEKHSEGEVKCMYCVENRQHPKLSRGETYSCGYKPYRCELCRYSTTTKGNLSIHMQSDKHLHAMQELPNSMASLGHQRQPRSPAQEGESFFVCLVCGCFSCDSLHEIMSHAEKDRSRPSSSDVSFASGIFRCHLCPYHTNLKANFQLHTRTDKHLQRVQLVNHIREGTNAASALCRLGAAKSVFQVLCRACQEILPTAAALRDHCDGIGHRTNLRQPVPVFRCRVCPFETQLKSDAFGHMACHDPATWPSSDKIDLDAMAIDEDAAYACASCGFTAKDANTLEEHARSHEEGELCPLCNERTQNITDHLLQDHKIAESAVEKLLQVHRVENIGNSTHTFRCNRCSLSFRSETALHSHSILHLFDAAQKCPQCSLVCNSVEELKVHTDSEHCKPDEENRCELCSESFNSRAQFLAHINSVRHLHEAKKQLEQGSVSLNQQVLSSLNPASPGEKKPFRCNVCKIGYGQGATLDIHLRSVAHQSRMNRLGELVAVKEIDPTKPILEQPGTAPQKLIKELIHSEEMPTSSQQLNMNMLFSMFMGQGGLNPFGGVGSAGTADADDDVGAPKTVTDLLNMLRTFGLDKINAACSEVILKLGSLSSVPDDQIPSLCKVDCSECGQTHSSIVLLGVHYQDAHDQELPESVLRKFCDRLVAQANDTASTSNGHESPATPRESTRDSSEPPEKRPRSGPTPPEKPDMTQMAMMSMMSGFPFMPPNPFMSPDMLNNLLASQQFHLNQSPAKRARTRISDDQLKILRQYFDINNSPTEAQIKEMSIKACLPEKVIKHWFRNTLFKERQRDKDSPYNFSVPPQVGIDLDAYEKTGETKVVPLTPEVKTEIKETEPKVKTELPAPSFNLATMMQQMQNPFPFPIDPQALMHSQLNLPSQPASTGRRANRTRFTDFQLRTLQQFFDKQAYPKDDDLEVLSKKLQLSPRVIVVWFQNARQKARKIYENQPNHENSDRFLRTPGCNFQCKRCNLVFQRYYELIQHQQKVCYKDDGLAQANDNKGVEEGLTDDEKALAVQSVESKPSPADILKLLGGGKSSTEALLKMCESANLPTACSPQKEFNKRCPICGMSHRSRETLIQHLAFQHSQQLLFTPIDVDSLPDADNFPTLSTSADSGVLDLSSNDRDLSMSPFLGGQSDGDDVFDTNEDGTLSSMVASSTPASRSPVNNKRYRTHLTPVQVHVMKSVFSDYKTPSMSECESLGRDIGLHKRVVQVWFQNARAKERKNRASNGDNDEVFRSSATNCPLCDVDYGGRVTMQDHLFSQQHLSALKAQSKLEGNGDMVMENGSDRIKQAAASLLKPKGALGSIMTNGFPFQFGNMPAIPLFFDQTHFGVPVSVLQVPDTVKEQIKTDMAAGQSQTRFTHDGETLEQLKEGLSPEDADCVVEEDVEVGWGCPTCTNVFQLETHLKKHQQQLCRGIETFTLVQTHYACRPCSTKYGTQREFVAHTATAEHLTRLAAASSS